LGGGAAAGGQGTVWCKGGVGNGENTVYTGESYANMGEQGVIKRKRWAKKNAMDRLVGESWGGINHGKKRDGAPNGRNGFTYATDGGGGAGGGSNRIQGRGGGGGGKGTQKKKKERESENKRGKRITIESGQGLGK